MKNYSYAIFADASCDLNPELRARFEVDGYLKGFISTPKAENIEGRIDMTESELEKFYSDLKSSKKGYTTSPASVDEMVMHLESLLEQGKDVIALTLSSNMSAAYKFMQSAKEIVLKKYPNRKIFVIDSRRVTAALGLLTVKACMLRAEGYPIEKTVETIEKMKNSVHQMGTLDDLFWVASNGRISNAKAFFGTLAGIKVLGDYNSDGMPTPIAKVSGYKKSFKAVVEYIKRTISSANNQTIFVAHSARKEQAETLAALIKEQIRPKDIVICPVQQVSGINIGPGMVSAYYFGTEITDLKHEKDVISDIIANKL